MNLNWILSAGANPIVLQGLCLRSYLMSIFFPFLMSHYEIDHSSTNPPSISTGFPRQLKYSQDIFKIYFLLIELYIYIFNWLIFRQLNINIWFPFPVVCTFQIEFESNSNNKEIISLCTECINLTSWQGFLSTRFGYSVKSVPFSLFMHLRYTLLPTFYTLAEEASRTGVPVIRSLFYEFPLDSGGWMHNTL